MSVVVGAAILTGGGGGAFGGGDGGFGRFPPTRDGETRLERVCLVGNWSRGDEFAVA